VLKTFSKNSVISRRTRLKKNRKLSFAKDNQISVRLSLVRKARKGNKLCRSVHSEEGKKMDVLEAIKTRRSIRRYKPEQISDKDLQSILEAARLAPSAGNRQPWRFIIVQNGARKKAVAEAANDQTFMNDAAAIVVATADPDESARWHEKDTMIALEHMVLTATSMGFGSCWIGAFDEDEVKRLLKIPARMKVVAILSIGIPDEKPEGRLRKDSSEIFFKEQWQIR
jgi:nitroreductase